MGFVLVATLLGLAAQPLLPNGISPITDITLIETDAGNVAVPRVSINPTSNGVEAKSIALTAAYEAFLQETTLFLDAREAPAFAEGHIQDAVNLPVEAFMDSLEYLDRIASERMIITYCDGEDCNASIDLAGELMVMGFSNVYFFFGGWQEWMEAGYPIEGVE